MILREIMAASARVNMAQTGCVHHINAKLPMPVKGSRIRCVFSDYQTPFSDSTFAPVIGRVYDVVAIDFEALEDDIEQHEKLRASLKARPHRSGNLLMLKDPLTGNVQRMAYPASPGSFFNIVAPDAVDEAQEHDLPDGTTITFTETTITNRSGEFTIGKPYTISNGRTACHCQDPQCAGRRYYIYDVVGESGETISLPFPFNTFGIATIERPTH